MTTVPSLTGKKLLAVLKRAGFEILRVKGSHHFLHPPGRPDFDWAPIGAGAYEIVVDTAEGGFRVMDVAKFEDYSF